MRQKGFTKVCSSEYMCLHIYNNEQKYTIKTRIFKTKRYLKLDSSPRLNFGKPYTDIKSFSEFDIANNENV